jgi:exodeoxyribonuclease VII small subunit
MTEKNYQETYLELQNLLLSLERDSVSVDELSEQLSRGFDLLSQLRGTLSAVEARVEQVINARLESKSNTEPQQD